MLRSLQSSRAVVTATAHDQRCRLLWRSSDKLLITPWTRVSSLVKALEIFVCCKSTRCKCRCDCIATSRFIDCNIPCQECSSSKTTTSLGLQTKQCSQEGKYFRDSRSLWLRLASIYKMSLSGRKKVRGHTIRILIIMSTKRGWPTGGRGQTQYSSAYLNNNSSAKKLKFHDGALLYALVRIVHHSLTSQLS